MPSEKSAERVRAEQIYRESKGSIKLVEIAEQLGVPPTKVRKWKALDKWEEKTSASEPNSKKKQVERSTSQNRSVPPNNVPPKSQEDNPSSIDEIISQRVEENTELTPQQRDFCRNFMKNRNATQAYLKAYGCSYAVANVNGPRLLVNARIKVELLRLREIKNEALGFFCEADLVELHMRIAFADITDFAEFRNRRVPTMHQGRLVRIPNPNGGDDITVTHTENEVRFRDSGNVDGTLLSEVSQGADGARIKLVDRQRSLAFLERYFLANPMDRHRIEYDDRRQDLELMKFTAAQQLNAADHDAQSSNLIDALGDTAEAVWGNDDDDK